MSGTDGGNHMSEVPIYVCSASGFAFWESGWEAAADSCPHCCTSANGWHWWSPWEHFCNQRTEHSPWPHCQQLLIANPTFLQFCKCFFPDNTSAVLQGWTCGSEARWKCHLLGQQLCSKLCSEWCRAESKPCKKPLVRRAHIPRGPCATRSHLTSAGLHRRMPVPQHMLWRLAFCVPLP